jgi:MoaA/NifB/PqqE/SkfB family radical SAM enzyme
MLEDEIEQLILEHFNEIESRYIVEKSDKLRRIARRFREHLGELPPQAPPCNAPWVSAVVEVDGSVRPCFFHPQVGSIAAVPLEEAVNSAQAKHFRLELDPAHNPICQRCVCSLNYKAPLPQPTDKLKTSE